MKHRLFFALWPDSTTRERLETARNALFPMSGVPVPPEKLHVTMAFLGAVDAAKLPALVELAGAVKPFSFELDRLEHWSKQKVLIAGCVAAPTPLIAAADTLWQRLNRLGFARETRPFKPHLTLAHDVRSARSGWAWPPLTWTAQRVTLIESIPQPGGSSYQPLAGT